jgi:hypothetical protein
MEDIRNTYKILVGRPEGKRGQDSIEKDLK